MPTVEEIITKLQSLADPDAARAMRHYAITGEGRLGLSVPQMRAVAKETGRDHPLALELWKTGIPEARITATLIADPKLTTPAQMDAWAADFNSWDVCDAACNNLFVFTTHAWDKVYQWADEEPEFTRRAGFVLIACLATHNKASPDGRFTDMFPLIKRHAVDGRNFVKKAVN